ncbi:SDR family oxidoreductase [Aestuariivita sp.]|jgi:3-oxoacyl-[acyl-carrier protein] reductase|uniref:SDR family NAD(P)-dependent oxidoreductase n=1 Tax=Aestuariivita sp. TaxID=1872407 RepID=UPI0021724CD5|nr:SDR family oxidoreductase [Aestuariivita sp.]MCE8009166.1 SDR family oxidoreductase [Aestuariivita sp.]
MSRRLAILGGCGGIGRQLVADAQAVGWTPVIFDLPASIDAHGIGGVEMHPVDASDPADAARAAGVLGEPLEGFVNLCGFMTASEPLLDRTPQDWADVINGNLNSAFFAASAFAPHVTEGGAIVQIGSGLGHVARPGYGPYAIAKAGIAALTRQMALELAPGIRVNCVAPAAVDTAFLRGGTGRSDEDAPLRLEIESYAANNPMKRIAMPADITGPILFLLSDQASYVTGQVLHVNGGAFMP